MAAEASHSLADVATGVLLVVAQHRSELLHPSVTSRFAVAYVVLAISTVVDLISFRQSAGQMSRRARRRNVSLLSESQTTSDPSLRTVFTQRNRCCQDGICASRGLV